MSKLLLPAIIIIVIIAGIYWYMQKSNTPSNTGSYGPQPTQTTTVSTTSTTTTTQTMTNIITTKTDPQKGDYLVGQNGMTLYTFDKDTTANMSSCTGACANLWPPYTTTQVPTNLPAGIATFKRADGTIQFSYKTKPIYYFANDKQPGDLTGDGYGGIWHIVKP